MIIPTISAFLIALGLLFFIGGAVGILRFPDFYTRMHAAGKGDTMSMFTIFLGLAIYQLQDPTPAHILVALKILLIAIFIMMTSPTSTHALIKAGLMEGLKMWRRKDRKEKS